MLRRGSFSAPHVFPVARLGSQMSKVNGNPIHSVRQTVFVRFMIYCRPCPCSTFRAVATTITDISVHCLRQAGLYQPNALQLRSQQLMERQLQLPESIRLAVWCIRPSVLGGQLRSHGPERGGVQSGPKHVLRPLPSKFNRQHLAILTTLTRRLFPW